MMSTRVLHEGMNYVESIKNLAYLLKAEADNPVSVRAHASQVDDLSMALGSFLHSITSELRESGC